MGAFSIWVMLLTGTITGSAAIRPVFAQDQAPGQAFDRCKAINDDGLRLSCFRSIIKGSQAKGSAPAGPDTMRWRLVKTLHGDRQAVSVMRTADTARSDPDLAGLMIRCGSRPEDRYADLEVLVVLLNPLPLRAHPNVAIKSGDGESRFKASIAAPGALVLLPAGAVALANGPWQGADELSIDVEDTGLTVHGIITLGDLRSALTDLSASCLRDAGPPQ